MERRVGDPHLRKQTANMRPTGRFSFGETVRMAMETLLENKLRSVLTVLGVFIAVVVLVMVFSIMYGVDADVRAQLEQYGTDTLFVYKFDPGIHLHRLSQELRLRRPLQYEDAEAIGEEAPSVREVCVQVNSQWPNGDEGMNTPSYIPTARYNGKEVTAVDFEGVTPSYVLVQNARLEQGRFLTESENLHRVDVAVIGHDLAETLFPAHDALGKELQVTGMTFRVIGVLEKSKAVFARDNSADKQVYHSLPDVPQAPSAGPGKLFYRAGLPRQEGGGDAMRLRPFCGGGGATASEKKTASGSLRRRRLPSSSAAL